MKKFSYGIICIVLLLSVSCKRDKTDTTPEGYIEYNGELLKTTEPVKYDSNGDGIIDEKDNAIEILGTNLNITETPDGKPLYSGSSLDDTTETGGGSSNNSLVPIGEKLCYMDLEKYCSKNGGLYAYETTINTNKSTIQESSNAEDNNNNGIADYIEDIRSTSNIQSIASTYASKYKEEAESAIEKASGKQISTNFVQVCIEEAIVSSLKEALYESNESINITDLETILKTRVTQNIITAVDEAGLSSYIETEELKGIAQTIADKVATDVSNAISTTISNTILSRYETQLANGTIQHVQGICPNGYHIPSDEEWMVFEYALGMSSADLTKCGETEITRGASANIVKKMVSDFGFNFGGYASINGTYAQIEEAGVYWSSTTGTDEKGDYVWVRQIDTSYTGVVRFKMYEKSGLSIRCFKD